MSLNFSIHDIIYESPGKELFIDQFWMKERQKLVFGYLHVFIFSHFNIVRKLT